MVWTEYDPANFSVPFNYSTILTQLALEVNSKSSVLLSFSEVSMGEHNSRARIAELIHRLLGKTVYLQARVVRKVVSAIHRINHYPADSEVCFVNTYPLDSDLSGGLDSVIQPSNNSGQILNI